MTIKTPSQNRQLFGHTKHLDHLLHAHAGKKLHHSLIFTGAEGIGKETLAFHFIKKILQDDAKIEAGSHPHLLLIQPVYDDKKQKFKRDITLDAFAELNNFLRLAPTDDKPRFVLINPADGMNVQTQNALLKVLEEPPFNTYFILITTHVSGLLPTIRSRCLIVPVAPLSASDFSTALHSFLPDLSFQDIETYEALAEGSIGLILRYKEDNILQLYGEFCQASLNWLEEKDSTAAMSLAERAGYGDLQDSADILIALYLQRFATFIKSLVKGRNFKAAQQSEERLFMSWASTSPQNLLQDYDRLANLWQEGIQTYLDRKVLFLSFLRVVSGA